MIKNIYKEDNLILFVGGPRHKVLQALIENNIRIGLVFIPEIENFRLIPSIEMCNNYGIPIKKISKSQLKEQLPEIHNKPCLSLGFPYLFPKEFLEKTRFVVNVHGTLLPKYRGSRTLNWVIENGDTTSGVTVHFVDEGCDTGDIILQKSFSVSEFDTGKSLYRKTLEFEPGVVVEALKMLSKRNFKVRSQQKLLSTQYPNRQPFHSEIDPRKPLVDLYNKIRAADSENYPAYFFINEQKICIKIWREKKLDDEDDML